MLVWTGGTARAGSNDEPDSVGERFESNNRPQGAVVDGWQVRPSAMLRGGYDDNITRTRGGGPSSSELELAGTLDAELDAGPYVVNLGASLGQTVYSEARDNDFTRANAGAAIALDLRPALLLRGSVSYSQDVEEGINNGIFVDGVFEPYVTRAQLRRLPLELGAEYRAGQLALSARAQIASVEVDPQTTQSGLAVPQDFRSGWESELRFRGGYDVNANMALFGEAAAGTHRYDDPQGDRDMWRVAAGSELKFSHLLVGEASIGYALQSLREGGETSGLTYDARLHWFASELVSFTLDAERSFDADVVTTASGTTSAGPVTHDRISVRAEWEPVRPLLIHTQVAFEQEKHEDFTRTDEFQSVSVGATYVLTRCLRLTAEGTYEFGTSDFAPDIERRRISLGLTAVY